MSEVIIYHAYNSSNPLPTYGNGGSRVGSQILSKLAKILAVLGIVFTTVSFAPSIWYWASSSGKNTVSELLYQTAAAGPAAAGDVSAEEVYREVTSSAFGEATSSAYQPRFDPTLTTTTNLKIPSIGVETEIHEATRENLEEALKKGVWRANDSGTPFNRSEPTILAAHRFGYLAWSNIFRRNHSFYNLPKLKVGEVVEITYKQRKYLYEVYAESAGEEITDYSADLILYTCENLNSPVRIFKYARLLEV